MSIKDKKHRELAQYFLRKVCVPLLYETNEPNNAMARGTGSLFDLDGRVFLITAQHIFKDVDFYKISVPVFEPNTLVTVERDEQGKILYLEKASVITLKNGNLHSTETIDLAFCELLDQEVISILKDNYTLLGYECLSQPKRNGNIIVAGWPSSLAFKTGGHTAQVPLYFETELIPPPQRADGTYPVEPYDFFLGFDEIEEIGGAPTEPFELGGISGGAVWQIDPSVPPDQLWTAELTMKFIGVEKSVKQGEFIRGTKVAAIPYLFESVDDGIATKMKEVLNIK